MSPSIAHDVVVTYSPPPYGTCSFPKQSPPSTAGHEAVTRRHLARRLAALKGIEFAGEYTPELHLRPYFVPSDALLLPSAKALRISTQEDLFGGCVAEAYAATKSITHPLVPKTLDAPRGWVSNFATGVEGVVLKGYSVFSQVDARAAAFDLLQSGGVRIKPALGIGGCGQLVAETSEQVEAALEKLDEGDLGQYGVVVEQNLHDVATYGIGEVRFDNCTIAYHGVQNLTRNHHGALVYGGSQLTIVRGTLADLAATDMEPALRLALAQAQRYDSAAHRYLPGFFASRRNYDVAQGTDDQGQPCSGVLEQSWRIGGASPAEVAALEVFATDPNCRLVMASSHEIYGPCKPPPEATVYFSGDDPSVGRLTKFSTIECIG